MTHQRLPDNPPSRYGSGGSGHRILRVLAAHDGHAIARSELQQLAGIERRKGFGFTLEQMAIDRLIKHSACGFYEITFGGVYALEQMEDGRTYVGSHPTRSGGRRAERCAEPQPSVRLFQRATA